MAIGILDSNPWTVGLFASPEEAARKLAPLTSRPWSPAADASTTNAHAPQAQGTCANNDSSSSAAAAAADKGFTNAHEPYMFAVLHPLDHMLGKLVLEARPSADPPVAVPPYVRMVRAVRQRLRCQKEHMLPERFRVPPPARAYRQTSALSTLAWGLTVHGSDRLRQRVCQR